MATIKPTNDETQDITTHGGQTAGYWYAECDRQLAEQAIDRWMQSQGTAPLHWEDVITEVIAESREQGRQQGLKEAMALALVDKKAGGVL